MILIGRGLDLRASGKAEEQGSLRNGEDREAEGTEEQRRKRLELRAGSEASESKADGKAKRKRNLREAERWEAKQPASPVQF